MQRYSVSQVNQFIKSILAAEEILYGICIYGEISDFVHHAKSGHFYFRLRDEESSLKCVMFESHASKVAFEPENGMRVILRGDLQVYHRDGVYQLYCIDLQPDGIGSQALLLEQRKEKLMREGLFNPDKKRPLPDIPDVIGVITSETGAALQDIKQTLSRRLPMAELLLYPALVQGEGASASIQKAIRHAAKNPNLSLLIIGRGGGGKQDLAVFNEEEVVRAVAGFPVPVISAVGHEVDVTLTDFAADVRAATPTAAAELATPIPQEDLKKNIDKLCKFMYNNVEEKWRAAFQRLEWTSGQLHRLSPEKKLQMMAKRLASNQKRLSREWEQSLKRRENALNSYLNLLETLSPVQTLKRGYSFTFLDGKPIMSIEKATVGAKMATRVKDGTIYSEVTEIAWESEENNGNEKGYDL